MCSLIRNTHPNCIYYTTFSVKMQRFFFVQTWIFSENKKTAKLRYDFAGKSDLCLGHGQALAIYPYNSVVHCLIWWQHRCLCDLHSFSQNSFTDIYLTNAKTHGIIIKLSHESESQGNLWITETVKRIGRSTVSGCNCSRKVHLTKRLKCGRMNRITVLDRLSRKREREYGMDFSS